jgi:hypothetical protein
MSERLALLKQEIDAGNALQAERDHSRQLYDRFCLLRRENLVLREESRLKGEIILRQEAVIRALVGHVPRAPRPPEDEGCPG